MTIKNHLLISVIMVLAAQAALAKESSPGQEKAMLMCQTCHGLDGVATQAMTPNLSAQQKDYLIIQLKAYRDGYRQHAQMSIIAKRLNDEDIEHLSEWYSAIKVLVTPP